MTDDIDQVLISALMEDSRRSLKALAQINGLSSPSVAERLRRLEERGVLKGYTVEIDPKCFGYQLQAIVRIRPLPGQLQEVERQIQAIAEFTEFAHFRPGQTVLENVRRRMGDFFRLAHAFERNP